jgi:hypothetical protein
MAKQAAHPQPTTIMLIDSNGKEFAYHMRPMDNEEPGSDEMRRRIAFKTGFRVGALQQLFLLDENIDHPMGQMVDFELDYFKEGRALGLTCSDEHSEFGATPWGDLSKNGGVPLLPILADRLCEWHPEQYPKDGES